MYLANKVQNIKGSADVLLECAGLTFDELQPIADAMEKGGRKAAAKAVTDDILEKVCADCRHARRMHCSRSSNIATQDALTSCLKSGATIAPGRRSYLAKPCCHISESSHWTRSNDSSTICEIRFIRPALAWR